MVENRPVVGGNILGYFLDHCVCALVTDDLCVLAFYHLRPERHAEEELDRALREILGQLTARHYRHFLMTIRAG